MQLSGHRNVQSINHYAVNSMDDQQHMSEILSRGSSSSSRVAENQDNVVVSVRGNVYPEGASTTSTGTAPALATAINNIVSTGNIKTLSQQHPEEYSQARLLTTEPLNNAGNVRTSPVRKRRRVAVIYDSSDDSQYQTEHRTVLFRTTKRKKNKLFRATTAFKKRITVFF